MPPVPVQCPLPKTQLEENRAQLGEAKNAHMQKIKPFKLRTKKFC